MRAADTSDVISSFEHFQVVFISKCAQQTPLTFEDYVYPQWANGLGWCIVAFPIVVMASVFLYTYCTRGGYTVSE